MNGILRQGGLGRRRLAALGSVALVLATAVTACGSDGESSADSSDSLAKIANYSGSDRAQKFLAGAEKEGTLSLYTNPTDDITGPIVEAFEKKYPKIRVKVTNSDSADLARRVAEEASAGRSVADVIETTTGALDELHSAELLSDYISPETDAYDPETVKDYFVSVRESYLGLGYNTDKIKPEDAPKTLEDLLDPKWKGQIALPTSATGVRWVGAMELARGKEFVEEMKGQEIKGQDISGRALADFVISGEVALSPTIYNSHVAVSSEEGAPIAWQPIEPVVAVPTAVALTSFAPHPHAAMLYIDFVLSKEGQEIYRSKGYDSARTDMSSSSDFEKIYVDTRDDYATEFPKWESDMRSLFVR